MTDAPNDDLEEVREAVSRAEGMFDIETDPRSLDYYLSRIRTACNEEIFVLLHVLKRDGNQSLEELQDRLRGMNVELAVRAACDANLMSKRVEGDARIVEASEIGLDLFDSVSETIRQNWSSSVRDE